MIIVMHALLILLSATYSTLFVHGWWHSWRITDAVEKGLGHKLKNTQEMYATILFAPLVIPAMSLWLLFLGEEKREALMWEMVQDMLDHDPEPVSDTQLTAVQGEVTTYLQALK